MEISGCDVMSILERPKIRTECNTYDYGKVCNTFEKVKDGERLVNSVFSRNDGMVMRTDNTFDDQGVVTESCSITYKDDPKTYSCQQMSEYENF